MAASSLFLAAAAGAGTTGMATVLAADPPGGVTVTGEVVDAADTPLAGVPLVITEELPPDGGLRGYHATTGPDGVFRVELDAWGTTAAPAIVTIRAAADATTTVVVDRCTNTYAVEIDDRRELALAETAEPKPLDLVAETTLLGEVCGTTGGPGSSGTPPPDAGGGTGAGATPRPGGAHASSPVTPPATDALRARLTRSDERLGPALVLGFVVGLAMAAVLLGRRSGARPRR